MAHSLGFGALIALSSCSHDIASDTPDSSYHGVIGRGLTVTVTNTTNQDDAAPFAYKYCSQFGREARFKNMTQVRRKRVTSSAAQFECVSSDVGNLSVVVFTTGNAADG